MQLWDCDAPDDVPGYAQDGGDYDDDHGDYDAAQHHHNDWHVLVAMVVVRHHLRNDYMLVVEEAFPLHHSHLPEIRKPIRSY